MNEPRKSTGPIAVAVVLFALVMPWRPMPIGQFAELAAFALVISLVGYVLVRLGSRWFARSPNSSLQKAAGPEAQAYGGYELWQAFRLSVVAALFIEMAGVFVGRGSGISPTVAFVATLIAQQIVFVLFEYSTAFKLAPHSQFSTRASVVISMMATSAVCTLANSQGLFVDMPSPDEVFPRFAIWPFLIPAAAAGIAGLLYRYRIDHR